VKRAVITTFIILIAVLAGSPVRAELPELIGQIVCDTGFTLFGTRIIPLGDQNGDGCDDIMTWDYRFRAYLYYGGLPFDAFYDVRIDSVNNSFNNVGDINGDGFDDFTIDGRSPVGWKLGLYYGGPTVDSVRDLWFGTDALYCLGLTATCQDIDDNGSKDLISRSSNYGSVLMCALGPEPDSVPELKISPPNMTMGLDYDAFGDGVITGLFNGDESYDLAVNVRFNESLETNGCVYLYWGGPGFDSLPDLIIPHPGEYQSGYGEFGRVLELLGDLNGDGYDDFIAGTGVAYEDTANFVFFGGPGLDSIPDITIGERLTVARSAGDVNNDGYSDLITSYPMPMSGSGHVHLYLGGPNMDDVPDLSIRNGDMPEYQNEFGMDCSGVGDVNGDGIDDFAFSAVEIYYRGIVYVWAGWDGSTDVEFDYEPTIPVDFSLSQNYPNPFNPSTTIEFSLPRRSVVSLTIHNILGERVRTLIDEDLPAGTYTIEWDGRNGDGTTAATGIYIYRLQTESGSISRKMLLLK